MTKDEALRLALEALEDIGDEWGFTSQRTVPKRKEAITAIKEALAQTEQEPVAYINVEQRKLEWAKYMSWDTPTVVNLPKIPLYTTPPQCTKQEPVAWINPKELLVMRGNAYAGAKDWRVNLGLEPEEGDVALYTIPPQRTRIELTDEERQRIRKAVLKEKNT